VPSEITGAQILKSESTHKTINLIELVSTSAAACRALFANHINLKREVLHRLRRCAAGNDWKPPILGSGRHRMRAVNMGKKKQVIEIPNAFVGKVTKPTTAEVGVALGSSASAWTQLVEEFATRYDVAIQEWKSYSPKYGWSLRLLQKKRTIIYLSPCQGCFRVTFILGNRAVKFLQHGNPSKILTKLIADAPRYPEGAGVRLTVRGTREMAVIRKLAEAKLAH
jgi:hypothetical protein